MLIIYSPLIASFVYLSFTPSLPLSASLSLSGQTRTLQVMAFSVKSHFNGSLAGWRIKKEQRNGEHNQQRPEGPTQTAPHQRQITPNFIIPLQIQSFLRRAKQRFLIEKIKMRPISSHFSSYIDTRCPFLLNTFGWLVVRDGWMFDAKQSRSQKVLEHCVRNQGVKTSQRKNDCFCVFSFLKKKS